MGRNKDQKVNRKNAAGIARNRLRDQRAADARATSSDDPSPDDGLHKECPKCRAIPGTNCITPTGKPAAKTHAIRLK